MCLYVVVYACILIIYACIITYVCLITLIAVSLGCIHDDVRVEPGSWLVVGMIPVFDGKKAKRTGNRTDTGATGAPRRRMSLHHRCFEVLLEGWNKVIQWADGLFRRTCSDDCSKAAYERERRFFQGTHIMHNSLWGVRGVDVQHMVCVCM